MAAVPARLSEVSRVAGPAVAERAANDRRVRFMNSFLERVWPFARIALACRRPVTSSILAGSHQLLTTNHQPPTTNHQPPTTNHQPVRHYNPRTAGHSRRIAC